MSRNDDELTHIFNVVTQRKKDLGFTSGGTGQAMRAAEHFGIPIFNLYFDSTLDELKLFMNNLAGV